MLRMCSSGYLKQEASRSEKEFVSTEHNSSPGMVSKNCHFNTNRVNKSLNPCLSVLYLRLIVTFHMHTVSFFEMLLSEILPR